MHKGEISSIQSQLRALFFKSIINTVIIYMKIDNDIYLLKEHLNGLKRTLL
jgi:hypothetical protein